MAKEETKKKTTTKKATTKKAAPKKPAAKKTTAPKKAAPAKKAPAKAAAPKAKKSPVLVQEKNQYGRMTIALVLIALVLVACYCGYQIKSGNWNVGQIEITEEEKNFKKEYETLNGTANNDGITHITVNIPEDNNVDYISLKEADKMLTAKEAKSGIILFAYASDPWSRNLIPLLLEEAKAQELEKIYYVNLMDEDGNDLRTVYTLDEKTGRLNTVLGSEEYYNIRTTLNDHLIDYTYYNLKGKKTTVKGEKYLTAPTVVAVKEGKIADVYQSVIEIGEKDAGATKVFTTEEQTNVKNTFKKMIKEYLVEPEEEAEPAESKK